MWILCGVYAAKSYNLHGRSQYVRVPVNENVSSENVLHALVQKIARSINIAEHMSFDITIEGSQFCKCKINFQKLNQG